MNLFNLGEIRNASVWNVFRMREQIDMEPLYQRESDIWTGEKRQLLIDTILNGFDVPKIYMHKFSDPIPGRPELEFAVIDGKQRLSAIWGFIQGKFALPSDFSYLPDETIQLSNLTYQDLARDYPDIKTDFDSYKLDIVTIETKDIELIEDMFSRLNEAMPLNAAEKRNARPGPLPEAVRQLVSEKLFIERIPFTNRRYRHYDLAAKMLLLASRESVGDTKKAYIDRFFESHRKSSQADIKKFVDKATAALKSMENVFVDKDNLLRSVGMISLYFILFQKAVELGLTQELTRPRFAKFESMRIENRHQAEIEISDADYRLLEFDRYTQSPNDGVALRFRLAVIDDQLFNGKFGFEFAETEI